MPKKKDTLEEWQFKIDILLPIAAYAQWEIFLNPGAKVVKSGYYSDDSGKQEQLLIARKKVDGKLVAELKAATFPSLHKKMTAEAKSSQRFRDKCKSMLTDTRKCEFCPDRFLCFTEKGKNAIQKER